jgi:hypothetical protein
VIRVETPNEADGRLIAAAPDFYDAARFTCANAGGVWTAYENELRMVMGNTNYAAVAEGIAKLEAALRKATTE